MFNRKSNDFNYFKAFINLSEYSLKAAQLLSDSLHEFDRKKLNHLIEEMHDIEHSADLSKHNLINKLAREFLPPIEREDIINLAEKIDDVTDFIEDVLLNINIFNVQYIPEELLKFADIILECCKSMKEALKEFQHFRKSKKLHNVIIEINNLEERADKLYINEMKKIYRNYTNPVKLMIWRDLIESMEKCCDACEDVANTIEIVVLKNL